MMSLAELPIKGIKVALFAQSKIKYTLFTVT